MIQLFFFIKLIFAMIVVLSLSFLAENVSPRVAGILSGYPTTSAISLFFYGLEISQEFATNSAIYNIIGLTAALSFMYSYYQASRYFKKFNILLSSITAMAAYFIVAWLLHFFQLNKFTAFFLSVISLSLFIFLFKEIKNIKIEKKIKLSFKVIIIRALSTALIILLITSIPKLVGPTWAGLFSGFPAVLFPLILIVHRTYNEKYAHTIIKNVPIGSFSVIIYSFVVSITYPLYGIYLGTAIAYAMATIYLIAYHEIKHILQKQHATNNYEYQS